MTFSTVGKSDATFLDKDQKAPYQGLLFPIDEAQSIRKDLIERDYLKLENLSLKRSVDLYKGNESIYQEQKTILLDQNDKLAKSLYAERQVTNWERLGWFVLGIGVTGLAIYGVKQITH